MQTATRVTTSCRRTSEWWGAGPRCKFDGAQTAVPKEQKSASKPAEALCYFAKMFQLEQEFAPLTAEERFAKRLEQEKPILEAL